MVAGKQCTPRSLHPLKHTLKLFNTHQKNATMLTSQQSHCKGNLVLSRKQTTHQLPGTKDSLFGP